METPRVSADTESPIEKEPSLRTKLIVNNEGAELLGIILSRVLTTNHRFQRIVEDAGGFTISPYPFLKIQRTREVFRFGWEIEGDVRQFTLPTRVITLLEAGTNTLWPEPLTGSEDNTVAATSHATTDGVNDILSP